MQRVYMAVPFEPYLPRHRADMGRVYSTRAAAEAYCREQNDDDSYMHWEVEEFTVDEHVA